MFVGLYYTHVPPPQFIGIPPIYRHLCITFRLGSRTLHCRRVIDLQSPSEVTDALTYNNQFFPRYVTSLNSFVFIG